MEECEDHVADKIRVIEERKHGDRIDTGAENDKGRGNQGDRGDRAQDKMDLAPERMVILAIDAQKVRDLRDAEKDHSRHTLLIGQKYEKKVRTHGADQADLRKQSRP